MANTTFTFPIDRFCSVSTAIAVTGGPLVLFTVTGGRVKILSLFGRVATTIGAGAATLAISANVAGTDSALAAASASIANSAVGRIFTVVGPIATALTLGTGEGGGILQTTPQVVNPCTIDLVITVGTTGTVDWYVEWVPMDVGAVLV